MLPLPVHDLEVDAAVHDEVNLLDLLLEVQDHVVFLEHALLHVELDCWQERVIILKLSKVMDLLEQLDLELDPRIVIAQRPIPDVQECVGAIVPEL